MNNKSKSLSVLLSIYHKENPIHFQNALLSIWDNQTQKPNEIVLVEDGPLTEDLYNVIELWQNKLGDRLKVIKLKHNLGTGQAKNAGLVKCSSEYVAVMDTDDISLPDRFEKQMLVLTNRPELIILGSQMSEFKDDIQHTLSSRIVPTQHSDIIKFAKSRSPFNHISVIYKKQTILDLGSYQHHLFMEDYNLWIRALAKKHPVANLPETLVSARVGSDMINRRKGWVYIQSEWQLMKLKANLGFQNYPYSFFYFIIRALPRFLPNRILAIIYNTILRK